MSYDVNRFRELFFDEAVEHVASMESGLLALEAGSTDPEIVHSVFRAAHSVKGVAGSLGFTAIAEFTHLVEGVLDGFRDGTLAIEPALVALIVRASDAMQMLIGAAAAGTDGGDVSAISAELSAVLTNQEMPSATEAVHASVPHVLERPHRRFTIRFAPKPGFLRTGQDAMLLLRELAELSTEFAATLDDSRLPVLDELEPQRCYLAWKIELATTATRADIDGVFMFVEDDCDNDIRELEPAVAATASRDTVPHVADAGAGPAGSDTARRPEVAAAAASIRVSADKVDALVDLVGEMIISQAMVNRIAGLGGAGAAGDAGALRDSLSSLHRQTRELQERVMAIRMLPVETIFSRFARLTRDLGAQLGKRVRLETSGAETELDKGMLERLGDPLTHLVRNSIDHGLEPADERRANGKSDEGTITLRAYHESGGVVIEVADDGRGLNAPRVREKALSLGLISNERLSDDEVNALIFAPGFSTAAEVTDVSGRGVGMDVVKRTVDELKGTISVTSRPGAGTTVRIRLPLTLAVLDGLVVQVAGESFVIPIRAIAESLRPSPSDIRDLLERGETIELRGESLAFVRLGWIFRLGGAVDDPSKGIVVVLEHAGKRFGLLVDDVVDEQQVVMKSLELNFRKVDGAMAATILGDGRVALIVDVPRLAVLAAHSVDANRAAASVTHILASA